MEQLNHRYESLHREPELSRREYRTADKLSAWLTELGLEVHRIGETAVIGVLHGGKPGKTVALRADMDALPINEQTCLPYASQNDGVMHACGHDFHMAAALGAATLLSAEKETLCGTVQFVFQPDEEDCGYADRLSAHEIMKDTVAVFGAHVDPHLPHGTIGIKSGPFYAAAATIDLTFCGKSTHGATPQNGIDALHAAATATRQLLDLRQGGDSPVVVSVGTLHAGTARNIIADKATLSGIIRAYDRPKCDEIIQTIRRMLAPLETQTGVTVEAKIEGSHRGITNPDACAGFVRQTATELLGEERVITIPTPLMTTEDFGEYLIGRDGCFYHFGVGGKEGLHSPRFAPDPTLLPNAAALHAAVIRKYLEK